MSFVKWYQIWGTILLDFSTCHIIIILGKVKNFQKKKSRFVNNYFLSKLLVTYDSTCGMHIEPKVLPSNQWAKNVLIHKKLNKP